jgi:DNA-binding XRE family transcriptional regulator
MAAVPNGKPGRPAIPADLLGRYQAGEVGIARLARLLGTSPALVYAELRRLGVDTSRSTRLSLLTARRKGFANRGAFHGRVLELYGRGWSLRQVAKETRLTAEGVRQILIRTGVELRRPRAGTHGPCPGRGELDVASFCRRLRALRTAAGLSQRGLAARSGLNHNTLCVLELGRFRPMWATLDKLARALGCGVEAFGVKACTGRGG